LNKKEAYRETLVKYRLKQAEETLRDGKILLLKGGSPRSITNRAYYSMFYSILALLINFGKATSKHSGAISLFDKHFVKSKIFPKKMSKMVHRAFIIRQDWDYRELVEIDKEEAKEM